MIIWLFVFCATIGGLFAIVMLIGVSLYDIRTIQHTTLRRQKQPKIIIAVEYNGESDRERILRLATLNYKKLFIIVNDPSRTSNLKRAVRPHSKRLAIYSSRFSFREATARACKRYKQDGGLVILLATGAELDEVSLQEAAHYMSRRTAPYAAVLNRYDITSYSIVGLLVSYWQSFIQLTRKLYSTFSLTIFTDHNDTIIYKDFSYMNKNVAPTGFIATSTAFFAGHTNMVTALAKPVRAQKNTWAQLTKDIPGNLIRTLLIRVAYTVLQTALLLFLVPLAYFAYIALNLHQPILFFIALGAFALFVLYATWSDSQLAVSDKLQRTATLPVILLTLPFWILLPFITCCSILLEMLSDMVKAKFPRRIGLFARVKDILRIV